MDNANYVYGEVQTSMKMHNGHESIENIINIANEIWKKILKSKEVSNEILLAELQLNYRDFNYSLPIVLRSMVETRSFYVDVLKKFLMKCSTVTIQTREDFLKNQVEYMVLQYVHTYQHHYDSKKISQYREALTKQILEEDRIFIELHKEVEEDIKKQTSTNDTERREFLYKLLMEKKLKESAC